MSNDLKLGLAIGLLSGTATLLLTYAVVEISSQLRNKFYRPRYVRSTYLPPRRRSPKHRAER